MRASGDPWVVPQFPLQQSLYMEGAARGFFFFFFCISVFCSTMARGGEQGILHVAVTELRLGSR